MLKTGAFAGAAVQLEKDSTTVSEVFLELAHCEVYEYRRGFDKFARLGDWVDLGEYIDLMQYLNQLGGVGRSTKEMICPV